jgi:hypothetical protein
MQATAPRAACIRVAIMYPRLYMIFYMYGCIRAVLAWSTFSRPITPSKRPFSIKMRFFGASTAILACASVVQSAAIRPRDLLDDLQSQATEALKEAESDEGSLEKRGGCSIFNANVRRDWYVDLQDTIGYKC